MHIACPLTALAPGDAVRLETSPPIAVFHTKDGELFALDDTCTHQDASLADGWVEGCEVEFPLHASA
jgi:3-phenylpropionate/trans-cinnamate dioxygenase ferredoxin subunit